MSLFSRFGERLSAATAATLGSQRAKGQLQRLDTVAELRRQWGRFLGQRGSAPTLGAMFEFLATYGIKLSDTDASSGARLTTDQQERMLAEAAVGMIRAGAVDFSPQQAGSSSR